MNIFKKLLSLNRLNKQIIVIIIDIILSLLASFIFLFLRFDNIFLPNLNQFFIIFLATLMYLPLFISFGLYNSIFRYSGIKGEYSELSNAISTDK